MTIQNILLGVVALVLLVSICREPKAATVVHLYAFPMWASIALAVYYGWEAAVIAVFIVAIGAVIMRVVGPKFAHRATSKISKSFFKACGDSLRHAGSSLLWCLTRGTAIAALWITQVWEQWRNKSGREKKAGDSK